MKTTRRLRELLAREETLMVPGACNPLTAKLIEQAGFEAVYMTGAGVTTEMLGLPDIGLATLSEMALTAKHLSNSVKIPVIADADTGYGNAINVMRTVWEYEQAGLAGLHIEDQVTPKRCGHVEGKECVSLDEFVGKVRAAVAARRDPDFVIIARTDAKAPLGFDESVKRGLACASAGADVVFPEALQTREEFADYAKAVKAPLLANMTEFGKTPYLTAREFQELGYRIVIYAMSPTRVALRATQEFLADLKKTGTQASWVDRMFTRKELYELIEYSRFTGYQKEFVGQGVDPIAQ